MQLFKLSSPRWCKKRGATTSRSRDLRNYKQTNRHTKGIRYNKFIQLASGTLTRAKRWPSMHKPTIHRKISTSSFLHHPLTDLSLITTTFFFLPYNLLFSSYTTVSVIRLIMYISRNARSRFCIRTPFTNSPTTNCLVCDEFMSSLWTKLLQLTKFARR